MKRNVKKEDMCLYVVTDRTWLGDRTLSEQVQDTIDGGATFIQIREKTLEEADFIAEAKALKKLTDRAKIPFVVNDAVAVALAVDADGVHIGQSDGSVAAVRAQIGQDKILGVSAQTVEQALSAQAQGADYLGVGAVFSTSTKTDAAEVDHETVKAICAAVDIPVVAIGGISTETLPQLAGTGVDGAAVISAILSQPDIRKATEEMVTLSKAMVMSHV